MAVSVVSGTGGTSGSTTATTSIPTSTAVGDRVVMGVVSGPESIAVATPAGWTLIGAAAVGTGTFGAAAGPRRVTTFYRDYDGVWTMPAVTTSGTGAAIIVSAVTFRKAAGETWGDVDFATGSDVTADTAFSVTTNKSLGLKAGDALFMLAGTRSNCSATVPTATATGVTIGSIVERSDLGTTLGNDAGFKAHTALVTAGTQTAALVMGMTLSVATDGGGMAVRVSSVAAPNPALSTFTEPFDGAALPARWTYAWGSGQLAVSGGKVTLSAGTYALIRAASEQYDLTASQIVWQVPTIPGDVGQDLTLSLTTGTDETAPSLSWVISGQEAGNMVYVVAQRRTTQGGALAEMKTGTIPMASAKHLRLREAAGIVYWDYSPDAVTWTNWHSVAPGITITAVRPLLMWGKWDAATVAGAWTMTGINANEAAAPAFTDSVALAGSGTLGIALNAVSTAPPTPLALAGSGTVAFSAAGLTVVRSGALGFTGSGALGLSAARPATSGALALSGGSALVLAGSLGVAGALGLTGSGQLVLSAAKFGFRGDPLAFTGAGQLVIAPSAMTVTRSAALALAGSGALALSPTQIVVPKTGAIAVALSGGSALGILGKPGFSDVVALAGSGVLSRTAGFVRSEGSLALSGNGNLRWNDPLATPIFVWDGERWARATISIWNGRAWLPLRANAIHIY